MNKKILFFVLIILIAGVLMYAYTAVPSFQKMVALHTEPDFTEDNIYSDLESLSDRLDFEILRGSDSFTVFLENMDVDEINGINVSMDGIYGSGESYQQVGKIGDTYKKVTITIKKTTNYYALQAYLKNEPIPEGEEKAKQLYEVICTIMQTEIQEGMSDYEKELALHDYLVSHCKYSENVNQPSGSDIYRAYGALVNGDAVCNGYAEAMSLLLRCVGISSEFVIGTAGEIDHAWNLVLLDGAWYHLDATWDDPTPDQGERVMHTYFNVTDEILEENHTWKHENYAVADDMEQNYFVKENRYFLSFSDYKSAAYEAMVIKGNPHYEAVIENYIENEEDMQFIFEGNYQYNSVSWQQFQAGSYSVLTLDAQ